MTRTALELIGQSGMGYSFDSLKEGGDGAYSRSVKRLVYAPSFPSLPPFLSITLSLFNLLNFFDFRGLLAGSAAVVFTHYILPFTARFNFPRTKRWIVDHTPLQSVQDLKEIADVLQETALDIYRAKQKAMESEGDDEKKKDIISILSEYEKRYIVEMFLILVVSESECECGGGG